MSAAPLGSAFTYQGRLNDGGNPANGTYDLRFVLFDAAAAGSQVGTTLTNPAVNLNDGLFNASLDFGSAFDGNAYWLEVSVRTNGGGAFVALTPRQPLTPTPYAQFAPNAGAAATAASATTATSVGAGAVTTAGLVDGAVTSAKIADGTVAPADLNLGSFDTTFWRTTGNSGTSPGVNFLGTTDNQALHLRVGGVTGLRLEPDPRGSDVPNVIGGYSGNTISTVGSGGSVIVGGGYAGIPNIIQSNASGVFIGAGSANVVGTNINDVVIVGGYGNTVEAYQSVISGGSGNSVRSVNSYQSVIAGGTGNTITNVAAPGGTATIGGGYYNYNSGWAATIAGGWQNVVTGTSGFIGGGTGNAVSNHYASVAGGFANMAGGYASASGGGGNNTATADYSVIAGGFSNTNSGTVASIGGGYHNNNGAFASTIGGGENNTAQTNADHSTIGGGQGNTHLTGAYQSFIGGGTFNSNAAQYAVIAGGYANTILAGGVQSAIGGGNGNTNGGLYAVVPGGFGNVAVGNYSFAGGNRAKALNAGAFVWADSQVADFASTAANQFSVRAAGGVRLETGGAGLMVDGVPVLSGTIGTGQITDGTIVDSDISPSANIDTSKLGTGVVSTAEFNELDGVTGPIQSQLDQKLDTTGGTMNGAIAFSSGSAGIQFPAVSGAASPMITMFASGTANADRMVIAHSSSFPNWGLQYQDGLDRFNFLAGGANAMTVDLGSRRVGIGTSTPGFQLELSTDSAAKPNGGSWANTSDARVKKNIQPLTGALDKLTELRGVTFEWINPQDHANQTTVQGGFVAQEVERAFPEWVRDVPGAAHDKVLTPDGRIKSLSLPFEFDALVVEAIRQLRTEKDAQIAALQNTNFELLKELAAQKELASQMQARFATIEKTVSRLAGTSASTFALNHEPAEAR